MKSLFSDGDEAPKLRLVRPPEEEPAIAWPDHFPRDHFVPLIPRDHPLLAKVAEYAELLHVAGPAGFTDREAARCMNCDEALIEQLRGLGGVVLVYESAREQIDKSDGTVERIYVHGNLATHTDSQHHWGQIAERFGAKPVEYQWNRP